MHIAKPLDLKQILLLNRVITAGIGEKQHQIDFVVGNSGTNLLLPALSTGE